MAQLGVQHLISHDVIYNNDYMAHVLDKVRRDVIEEVFGEFRLPLRELRHNLYDRDCDKAMETLESLEKQMFNV
jgi:hypothetical protein